MHLGSVTVLNLLRSRNPRRAEHRSHSHLAFPDLKCILSVSNVSFQNVKVQMKQSCNLFGG